MSDGTPVAAAPATEPWRALYPFESRWLRLNGSRLHYVDEGQADGRPTLLFVHGNPTWSFHWRELIAEHRETHRCVAVDHLGCGLSDKPQRPFRLADRIDHLLRLVDTLELKQVTLVAQDWGGAIGLGAMLERRELLERIVLFNTGAFPPWFIPWRIGVCKTPLLGKAALQGLGLFSQAALRMTLSRRGALPSPVSAGYLAPYNTWRHRRAVYEFVADIPRSRRHPTWATLTRIESALPQLADRPIKLIWGMRDWCFTPACLERFLSHWPDADVSRLADVGHWVLEDAPEETFRLVAEFLQTTATPAESSHRPIPERV